MAIQVATVLRIHHCHGGHLQSGSPCRLVRRHSLHRPAATGRPIHVGVDFYGGNNGATPTLDLIPSRKRHPNGFIWCSPTTEQTPIFTRWCTRRDHRSPGSPQTTKSLGRQTSRPSRLHRRLCLYHDERVKLAADTVNPLCIGDIQENNSILCQGYRAANAIGLQIANIQRLG